MGSWENPHAYVVLIYFTNAYYEYLYINIYYYFEILLGITVKQAFKMLQLLTQWNNRTWEYDHKNKAKHLLNIDLQLWLCEMTMEASLNFSSA